MNLRGFTESTKKKKTISWDHKNCTYHLRCPMFLPSCFFLCFFCFVFCWVFFFFFFWGGGGGGGAVEVGKSKERVFGLSMLWIFHDIFYVICKVFLLFVLNGLHNYDN